ncbi:MAG: hypothetical protein ACO1SV_04365 [Fimbriimonas sp.]
MVLVALALAVLDRGTTMGEVRALVPPDLRPPATPSEAENGWTLAMHATGQSGPRRVTAEELQNRAWELAAKELGNPSREGGAKRPPAPQAPSIADYLMKWPDAPSPEYLKGARQALAPFGPRLRYLEAALARPVWAPPRMSDAFRPQLDEVELDFPVYASLKELAKALSLRARVNAAEGHLEAAVADIALVRRTGSRLAGGHTPMMPYLVGIAIEAIGDHAAIQVAASPNLREEHVAALQKTVADSARPNRLADTLRNEFDAHFVRMVAAVPTDAADLGPLDEMPASLKAAIKGLPIYDRRDTVEGTARLYRAAIENGTRPWSAQTDIGKLAAAQVPDWPNIPEPKPGQKLSPSDTKRIVAWMRANPNVLGRQFVGMFGGTPGAFEEAERRTKARRRLTIVALAIRRSTLRFAQAPGSLQALVDSKLLPEIPGDPFAKGSLRYDPARKVVWSVGPDGRDDGGSNRPNSNQPDIVIAVP